MNFITRIKNYIKNKQEQNKDYEFDYYEKYNINNKKQKKLVDWYEFKKTKAYEKAKKRLELARERTDREVKTIKKYKIKISENIELLKENLKDIKIKEKKVIDNYINFCIYYITNFNNIKMLKLLNLFLNYTIKIYIQKKEIKDLSKFKKQIHKSFNLLNKKIEAKSIFKDYNFINFSLNNFLLKNKNLLKDIDKKNTIRKDADKLAKISERRKKLRQKEQETNSLDEKLAIARNFLNNLDKKFKDD